MQNIKTLELLDLSKPYSQRPCFIQTYGDALTNYVANTVVRTTFMGIITKIFVSKKERLKVCTQVSMSKFKNHCNKLNLKTTGLRYLIVSSY